MRIRCRSSDNTGSHVSGKGRFHYVHLEYHTKMVDQHSMVASIFDVEKHFHPIVSPLYESSTLKKHYHERIIAVNGKSDGHISYLVSFSQAIESSQ